MILLILKFPLKDETRKEMEREHWIVDTLQGRTSIAIPMPVFIAQHIFCYSYQKVPGILLTDRTLLDLDHQAETRFRHHHCPLSLRTSWVA